MPLADYLHGWDSEQRSNARWTRGAIALLLLFVLSGIYSWSELRYVIWGRATQAQVTTSRPAPSVGRDAVTLRYAYQDQDQTRQGEYTFTQGLEIASQVEVMDILYIPGSPSDSKPAGQRRWWAVIVFATMTTLLAGAGTVLYLHVRRELNPSPAATSRRPRRPK
ncbi:MAG: hypothetical protein WD042_16735 [Phycisphaeraceae bacterium]